MKLFLSKRFLRDFKGLIRQNVQIRSAVEKTLQKLAQDCFHPSLKTHKLKGDLEGCWSCSIDYSNRIIFEFELIINNKKTISVLIITMRKFNSN